MRRRKFITLLGGAVLSPLQAWAQQRSLPVIGFINAGSPDAQSDRVRAFRQGLKDTGHVDGENITIEYRWGENQTDRLPTLVAEFDRSLCGFVHAGASQLN